MRTKRKPDRSKEEVTMDKKNNAGTIVGIGLVSFVVLAVLNMICAMLRVYGVCLICTLIMVAELIAFFVANGKAKKAQKENDRKDTTQW